jgi:hypothetical protein
MAKDPAFLFYSQDFIVGVQTMPFEDRGKYITILCQMHQQGRLDEETIRFIVGSISDKLRLKFKIDEKGLWYNERLELETTRRNNFTESRRLNGNLGGRPKKEKPKGKAKKNLKDNPKVMHTGNRMGNEDVNDNENNLLKGDEIIFPFTSEKFIHHWELWKRYRTDIKKPYRSALSEQAALKKLSEHTEETAIRMIEESIANSWQGIFKLKEDGKQKQPSDKRTEHLNGLASDFEQRVVNGDS